MSDTTKVRIDIICVSLSTVKYAEWQKDINALSISEVPSRQTDNLDPEYMKLEWLTSCFSTVLT